MLSMLATCCDVSMWGGMPVKQTMMDDLSVVINFQAQQQDLAHKKASVHGSCDLALKASHL